MSQTQPQAQSQAQILTHLCSVQLRDKGSESAEGKSPAATPTNAQRTNLQAGLVSSFTGQSAPTSPTTLQRTAVSASEGIVSSASAVQTALESQRESEPRREQHTDRGDANYVEDDNGDDEQTEEEEEPKLKYQRLGFSVEEILRTKQVSSFLAHDKFLVC